MKGTDLRILEKLRPHLAICEWGRVDAETIISDIILCRKEKLSAISALAPAMPVLDNLADQIKVFALIHGVEKLSEIAARKNAAAQLFLRPGKIAEASAPDRNSTTEIILSFALKDILHTDWGQIMLAENKFGASGFLFIDARGKYMHRFYNFLDIVRGGFTGELSYSAATNDIEKLEAARRLVEAVRPELLPKFRLFVTKDFFLNLDNGANPI